VIYQTLKIFEFLQGYLCFPFIKNGNSFKYMISWHSLACIKMPIGHCNTIYVPLWTWHLLSTELVSCINRYMPVLLNHSSIVGNIRESLVQDGLF
jgi:hypothetical protein